MTYKEEYEEMLAKFSGNRDLVKLIEKCILFWEEEKEVVYAMTGSYPPQRNLLVKLKFDLEQKENEKIGG